MPATVARTPRTRFTKHASDDGIYWTSSQSIDQLRHAMVKAADLGGDQETGFEQAFSSLAYSLIKDKSPRLIDYAVGFQLVERDEDNTKAVGVFGFKVGKQWLYVPIFFLNGDLKGHELLYLKNQDIFIPNKENWVNYILSRKPHVLGEGSARDVFQLGGLSPNIERLSRPPSMSKYGMAIDRWAGDFLPLFAACRVKAARFLYRQAPADRRLNVVKLASAPATAALAQMPTLDQFLGERWQLAAGAWQMARTYPGIKAAFDRFYGPDFFPKLVQRCKTAWEQAPLNLLDAAPVKQAAPRFVGSRLLPEAMTKAAAGDAKVQIVTRDEPAIVKNLPDEQKEKVLRHGYLVKDERTGEEVTKVYNTQLQSKLLTPDATGIYEVLQRPASFARMLVIKHPKTNTGGYDFATVVRLDDGAKAWINVHANALYARPIEPGDEYRSWWKGLPEGDDLKKGSVYVAVSERGEGTVPFTVREVYEDGDYEAYRVDFHDEADWRRGHPTWIPRTVNTPGNPYAGREPNAESTYNAILVCDEQPHAKLRAVGPELRVPVSSFKFLKLKDPPKPKKDENDLMPSVAECCGDCGSDPKPIVPGDLDDVQNLFLEKTARVKLHADGPELVVTTKQGSVKIACRSAVPYLVRTHGVNESSAAAMLKDAVDQSVMNRPAVFQLKYADYYPLPGPGPTAPPIPAPQYGTEQMGYNSATSIYPQEDNIPVPGLDSNRTDPRVYDPFILPDPNAMRVAQQAGEEGQKEVFDTATIGAMLKSVRQDTLTEKYLGDLMKAVDRIARIMCLFWYHNEEFADRYGKQDLPQLEDGLRNTLESLGDITLFLKEKSVNSGVDRLLGPNLEHVEKD